MSTTLPPLPGVLGPPVDIPTTFGVLYISTLVCTGLIGITTLQAWFYFLNHTEDQTLTKLTVAAVWCTEFVRCAFLAHASYYYVVSGWGDYGALTSPTWSIASLPLMTVIGEVIVQLYFAQKVWILSGRTILRWVLTLSIAILAICTFGMGLAVYIIGLNSTSWPNYLDGSQRTLVPASLSISMVTNLFVTLSLIFLLHKLMPQLPRSVNRVQEGSTVQSHQSFPRTVQIINTLMFYIIQAGTLIVIVDVVVIALEVHTNPLGFAYIGVYAVQGNLYANSLLASLNGRIYMRSALPSENTLQVSDVSRTRNKRSRFQWSVNMTDVDSNIQRPAESYQLRNLTSPIPILKPEGINVKYYDA